MSTRPAPHPLAPLSRQEHLDARDAVVGLHGAHQPLYFRAVHLLEPRKDDLIPFLEAEHAGAEPATRPPRQAQVEYDVVAGRPVHARAVVDLGTGRVVSRRSAGEFSQPYFTVGEFSQCEAIVVNSRLFQDAMADFELPAGFRVTVDPWPYGGCDEQNPRYMQGLVFARDGSHDNADSNHYAYPIPLIPVIDWASRDVVRVDRLATGGTAAGTAAGEKRGRDRGPRRLFARSRAAEYVPELLERQPPPAPPLRPLDVVQPEGASFAAHADGLVEWQRWRFRVGFTPREGAVLHDVCFDGRPVAYRLSYSELTVPYADPRPPFHRKQAFDFGDGGVGRAANSLELGCDCLGAVHYLDAWLAAPDGEPARARSVVCLHEQDAGLLWKHTNFRTARAVVARARELVVQFVCTLANYEYVLAFKLDLAGAVTLETRATGIVSVVAIDDGETSPYGTVVAPGVLAQNHQHIFAARIDPAIDSYRPGHTRVVVEESRPAPVDPHTNPHGNLYNVCRAPVDRAAWVDAEPRLNRVLRLENPHKKNPSSGNNVGYKLVAPATQMMLAHEESVLARRAPFARHDAWVTGFRDGELWAAGEFTNQSCGEQGGVAAMVRRGDWFTEAGDEAGGEASNGGDKEAQHGNRCDDDANEAQHGNQGHDDAGRRSSPVVWTVYGLTHNPRVEDWPVMPAEVHQIHLRPADFFNRNPALDVPSKRNETSVLVPCCGATTASTAYGEDNGASAQDDPLRHLQGSGPGVDAKDVGARVADKKAEA